MTSLPIFLPLCWLIKRATADALISVFSEVSSGCSSVPRLNYTLVSGTGLLHGQWLDKVARVRNPVAAAEQLSSPGRMLVQCIGDADWMFSWCPLLDETCRTTLEEPKQLLPSSAESYRIAAEQVQKFLGGYCINAVGLHDQQQQSLQLSSTSDLKLPEYGACRAVARALEAVPPEVTTTTPVPGPGTAFGVALLVTALCTFSALIGSVALLNRVCEWGDPCPPAHAGHM